MTAERTRRPGARTRERQRRRSPSGVLTDEDVYVYAIAAAGAPARMRLLGTWLHALEAGKLTLIVERGRSAVDISEAALRRQHAIVEALARRLDPMLPVRFGTAGAPGDLQSRILASSTIVQAALERVRGMTQMTIRIHRLSSSDPRALRFGDSGAVREPTAGVSGTVYLERRRAEQVLLKADARAIAASAGPLVVDERIDASRPSGRGTIFHLIRKTDVAAYRRAIESCEPSLEPATLVISGPFAPFAFAPDL